MLQASNFQASQLFPGSSDQRQLSFKLDQLDIVISAVGNNIGCTQTLDFSPFAGCFFALQGEKQPTEKKSITLPGREPTIAAMHDIAIVSATPFARPR